jgi:hypothetical protein
MHDFERVEVDPTATVTATLVAISEDQRESELLALFRSADERGKHCMVAMARCMPCMRGG